MTAPEITVKHLHSTDNNIHAVQAIINEPSKRQAEEARVAISRLDPNFNLSGCGSRQVFTVAVEAMFTTDAVGQVESALSPHTFRNCD